MYIQIQITMRKRIINILYVVIVTDCNLYVYRNIVYGFKVQVVNYRFDKFRINY